MNARHPASLPAKHLVPLVIRLVRTINNYPQVAANEIFIGTGLQ